MEPAPCYHERVMEKTPDTGRTELLSKVLAGALSALLPGLGQLVRGRLGDAALCLLAATWIHGFFAGLAVADERADPVLAAVTLAFGLPNGFVRPVAVVFCAFGLALHAFAAWDATRTRDEGARVESGETRLTTDPRGG